jgi:hypothetical protein
MAPPAVEEVPPPPPFEDSPERPLFAGTERRPPATAGNGTDETGTSGTSGPGTGRHAATTDRTPGSDAGNNTGNNTGSTPPVGHGPEDKTGFWPFVEDDDAESEVHTGKEGRGWLRTAVLVGVVLVVVIAMFVAFALGRGDGSTPGPSSDGTSSGTPSNAASVVKIAGATDFDPEGDPSEENPEDTDNAVDGDPATSWTTMTYRGNPALGGLKSGVGLMLDLGRDVEARSVTVRFGGSPTSFEVYAAPPGVTAAPDSLESMDKVGSRSDAPERTSVTLDPTPRTRYLLVWLTRLPAADGGYRGEITDVTVRS